MLAFDWPYDATQPTEHMELVAKEISALRDAVAEIWSLEEYTCLSYLAAFPTHYTAYNAKVVFSTIISLTIWLRIYYFFKLFNSANGLLHIYSYMPFAIYKIYLLYVLL